MDVAEGLDDLIEDARDDSADPGVVTRTVPWKDRIVAEQKDVLVGQRSLRQSKQQVLTRMRAQQGHLNHTYPHTLLANALYD